jgi:hypothetical protein
MLVKRTDMVQADAMTSILYPPGPLKILSRRVNESAFADGMIFHWSLSATPLTNVPWLHREDRSR